MTYPKGSRVCLRVERLCPDGLANHRASIYSQVVVAAGGRTVYLAGQVSRDADGETVGVGDPAAQTEQVIRNMRIALAAVGAELRDLVKVTVYTTDLRFLPEIDAVRRRHFTESLPISTLLEVRKLSRPEYLIEIDGIAVIE
jgi:enamine deaminase RidA (YjgF/YER057c/UK114 family)